MATRNEQTPNAPTTRTPPDDPLAQERRRSAQLADELEATRLEMNVTTFVRAQGGTDDDASAIAPAVEAQRKQTKATGATLDWVHVTKLALHERKTAAGQPSIAPVNPKGEPMHPGGRTAPRSFVDYQAERERYRQRLREQGLIDPATQSYSGDLGALSGGPIRR